jgi:hypothetical protein
VALALVLPGRRAGRHRDPRRWVCRIPPGAGQFDLYAADGQWHGVAVQDHAIDEHKWAVGHFSTLNLRTGGIYFVSVLKEDVK